MENKNNILEIKNLSKIYHTNKSEIPAIKDLNLNIKEGEFVAIVGPSGCGKTTLLSILCGLEDKSSGDITLPKDKLKVGYMLQTDTLFPWLNILDNALLGLEIKKEKTKENIQRTINLLKKYGLYDFKDQYPHNLSGGMRQRVALIRTLATNPDLLLLDEPYSALDYQTRLALSNDLFHIIKNEGKTAILITHDIADAIFPINIIFKKAISN
jgi:NitT/TauT family transport system ATP-binding protein